MNNNKQSRRGFADTLAFLISPTTYYATKAIKEGTAKKQASEIGKGLVKGFTLGQVDLDKKNRRVLQKLHSGIHGKDYTTREIKAINRAIDTTTKSERRKK